MTEHGTKFGRKKGITHRNLDEPARAIGITVNTLMRWMQVPEFQTAYREARRVSFRSIHCSAPAGFDRGVSTLLKIMVDPNSPASVRVRAADIVLNHSKHAIEIREINRVV